MNMAASDFKRHVCLPEPLPHPDGETYDPEFDYDRLSGQILRVFDVMKDSRWRTVNEIHWETNDPHPSISTRLRDFRKKKYGSHIVERRTRGDRSDGLYEYRLLLRCPVAFTLVQEEM